LENSNPDVSVNINVQIKLITGRNFIVNCSPNDTVLLLKQKIRDLEGFNVEEQALVFGNVPLFDNNKLIEYNIVDGRFFICRATKMDL
jgi:hypothetical protein